MNYGDNYGFPPPSNVHSAHSIMYWEGYQAASSHQVCRCPYNPASEAAEDFVAGYIAAKSLWKADL